MKGGRSARRERDDAGRGVNVHAEVIQEIPSEQPVHLFHLDVVSDDRERPGLGPAHLDGVHAHHVHPAGAGGAPGQWRALAGRSDACLL